MFNQAHGNKTPEICCFCAMIMNKTDGKCLNLVISKRKMMLFIEWHNHIQRKRTVSALIRSSPFVPLSQEAVKSEISV